MFNDTISKSLADVLDRDDVKTRKGAEGRAVPYLEAWDIIDKANQTFGFGNWESETLEMREVHTPVMFTPPPTRDRPEPKAQVVACYAAKVRVTVWGGDAHDRKCVREGWSAHRSFSPTVGEAVENAIKGAETDAMKRAFRTFGNMFGLALYDKSQRNVGKPSAEQPRQLEPPQGKPVSIAPIDEGFGDVQPAQPLSNSQRALQVTRTPSRPQGQVVNGSALPANAY